MQVNQHIQLFEIKTYMTSTLKMLTLCYADKRQNTKCKNAKYQTQNTNYVGLVHFVAV